MSEISVPNQQGNYNENRVGDFNLLSARTEIAIQSPLSVANYPTAAKQKAILAQLLVSRIQGTVKLGVGVWNVSELEIGNGTTLEGAGNKDNDGLSGTVLKIDDITKTYILRPQTGGETRNITIKNLTFDIQNSTNASAFLHELTAFATSDITFENVTFRGTGIGVQPLCYFYDPSRTKYCCGLTFTNCRWVVPDNGTGLKIDTSNNTTYITAPKFYLGAGSIGSYFGAIGNLQVDNYLIESQVGQLAAQSTADRSIASKCNVSNGGKNLTLTDATNGKFTQNDVGHPVVISGKVNSWITGVAYDGLSASINDAASAAATNETVAISRYYRNEGMPWAGFYFTGNKNTVQFNNGIDESIQFLSIFEGSAGDGASLPVSFNDCIIQSKISVISVSDVKLNINGGRAISNLVRVGDDSQLEAYVNAGAVILATNAYDNILPTPKLDDVIEAGGVFRYKSDSLSIGRPIYKINIGDNASAPVGGYTLEPFSGWVNDAATSTGVGTRLDGGAQAWDARAIPFTIPSAVLNCIQYGSPIEQTYTGLVPNAAYDIGIICGWNGSSFNTQVKLNGKYIGKIDIGTANGVAAYELVYRVFRGVADSSGHILLRLESSGTALFNAVTVSRAPDTKGKRLSYRSTISQSGTNAPISTVIENTFPCVPSWSRGGIGSYVLAFDGDIFLAKEAYIQVVNKDKSNGTQVTFTYDGNGYSFTLEAADGDDYLSNFYIEIHLNI